MLCNCLDRKWRVVHPDWLTGTDIEGWKEVVSRAEMPYIMMLTVLLFPLGVLAQMLRTWRAVQILNGGKLWQFHYPFNYIVSAICWTVYVRPSAGLCKTLLIFKGLGGVWALDYEEPMKEGNRSGSLGTSWDFLPFSLTLFLKKYFIENIKTYQIFVVLISIKVLDFMWFLIKVHLRMDSLDAYSASWVFYSLF